ncbi:MAG: penicillin-binding protein activator [Gammaproteobacteria bacterium]|nr:penicillin-binding protein activator [Gammaproteobacteria bacterium]
MRKKGSLFYNALRGLVLLALLASVTACQVPVRWADSGDNVAKAEQAVEQGRYRDAAQIYLDLADHDSGSMADHWRLLAARQWLNSQDLAAASKALNSVSGPMDRDNLALWSLLDAKLLLYQDKAGEALNRLEESPPPTAASAAEFYSLKGDILLRLNQVDRAIQAFNEEQTWLNNTADILSSQQRLLDLLEALEREGRLGESTQGEQLEKGWIALARMSAQTATDGPAFLAGLRGWRMAFPQHPASTGIVAKLMEQYRGAGSYPVQVALLLPLSGREQAYGEAVRDGFLAAYLQSPNKALLPLVRVYDTRQVGAAASYHSAIIDGADMIVGPLLRDDVTQLMGSANGEAPVLALNLGNAGGYVPPVFYQFALDPEEEAREVARRALADGHVRAIALVPASSWGKRLLDSFTAELGAVGGELLTSATYDPAEQDYSSAITRALNLDQSKERYRRLSDILGMYPEFEPRRREDVEFIFVAAQPEQGRLIRPQLKFHYASDLPVYATSAIYQPDVGANKDLDGLAFTDMPWLLSLAKDNSGLHAMVATSFVDLQENQPRLVAMGVDAFRLLPWLYSGQQVSGLPGATGVLSITANGIVQRQLEWARFSNGRPLRLQPKTLGSVSPVIVEY